MAYKAVESILTRLDSPSPASSTPATLSAMEVISSSPLLTMLYLPHIDLLYQIFPFSDTLYPNILKFYKLNTITNTTNTSSVWNQAKEKIQQLQVL